MILKSCEVVLSNPQFNSFAHLAQAAFEKMIGAVDDHKFFRLGKRINQGFESRSRPKLVAAAADKQLRLSASAHRREVTRPILHRLNWYADPNRGSYPG